MPEAQKAQESGRKRNKGAHFEGTRKKSKRRRSTRRATTRDDLQERARQDALSRVGGSDASDVELTRPHGQKVRPGEVHFSERASAASSAMVAERMADPGARHYFKVLPDTGQLQKDMEARAAEVESVKSEQEREGKDGYAAWYAQRVAYLEGNTAQLGELLDEVKDTFSHFNGWTDIANMYFASRARLDGMLELYGVQEPGEAVEKLVRELEASMHVAQLGRDSYRENSTGGGEDGRRLAGLDKLDLPRADGSINRHLNALVEANAELQVAYRGFKSVQYQNEISRVDREDDAAEASLKEIQETKDFLKNIGSTIDTTTGLMNSAPTQLAAGANKLRQGEAALAGWANRRKRVQGELERDEQGDAVRAYNPTYISYDKEGDMTLADAEFGTTQDLKSGDISGGSFPGGGLTMPTNISEALEIGADFYYRDDILKAQMTIAQAQAKVKQYEHLLEANDISAALDAYANALNAMGARLGELQDAMVTRKNTLREFGEQLDRFAASSDYQESVTERFQEKWEDSQQFKDDEDRIPAELSAAFYEDYMSGQEVTPGTERNAALYNLVGVIEEVMTLGARADSSMSPATSAEIEALYRRLFTVRGIGGEADLDHLEVRALAEPSKQEEKPFFQANGQARWFQADWAEQQRYEPVIEKLHNVVNILSGKTSQNETETPWALRADREVTERKQREPEDGV